MVSLEKEFCLFGCEWPAQRAEQEEFLRSIPAVMWERNAGKAALLTIFGWHMETVELTLRPGRGSQKYQVWDCLDCNVLFRDPPPTLIIKALLAENQQQVSLELALMSGEGLAAATFDLRPDEPLIMGHITMIAYKGAIDAGLLESIYQEVHVLLGNSSCLVPDGVVLWVRSSRGPPPVPLTESLARAQRLPAEALEALDTSYLPGFVGPALDQMKRLPPSARLLPWLEFTGGTL